MGRLFLTIGLSFLLVGCGGLEGDPTLYGANITVETSAAPFTQAPDFKDRLRRTLAVSANFLKFPTDRYSGLHIVLTGNVAACDTFGDAQGCYGDDTAIIVTRALSIERSTLSHELLHHVIGDSEHKDPRWRTLKQLGELLDNP